MRRRILRNGHKQSRIFVYARDAYSSPGDLTGEKSKKVFVDELIFFFSDTDLVLLRVVVEVSAVLVSGLTIS